MSDRPNVLFLITDQHRADWLGCTGHPVVRTPNIDALAAQGTMFTDFHVASPVCMPNRASLMTGRMPSQHGLRYNGCALPETARTFVDVLAAGGYDTALIGKSHLQPFTTVPPRHPAQPEGQLLAEAWAPDTADYGHEQPERYERDERYVFPASYYGFQHVDMVTGHGDVCGGHYLQWLRQTRPDWQALTDRANELPHDLTCPQAYRTPMPEEVYPTHWIGDRAVDYVTARGAADAPFFAFVSFPDPHHPFNPPGRYWDMYDPDDFNPDLPYEAHANPTPGMQYLSGRFEAGQGQETPQSSFRASRRHVQEAMALTAGMITMIDDQVGRIIAALKDSGQYENTVIVFTSDHGDYLGDFGLMLKGALPFRGITRVPMIWSDVGRTARVCDGLAGTVDIGATILERAGLAPYNGMYGQSFLSAVEGGDTGRDAVFIEHNDGLPRTGFARAARVRTLVTKQHRLSIYHGEDWGEFYDLDADPQETRNLWADADAAEDRARVALRLLDEMAGQMDRSPLAERLA